MKITKINLEHFKGVNQASINLGDLTVITGKNSSGKSSVIQSLKYLTQWFKRIQTTRGLNEFSAPSIQVLHPDFITENKDYDSIRNSKAPNSEGVGLGVELDKTNNNFFMNPNGKYSIYVQFENVNQEGNKVRPKNLFLSLPKHWNEASETFEDEKFEVIYHNTDLPRLISKRDKYFELYANGQFLDRILQNNQYIDFQNFSPIKDKSKKIYLHTAYDGFGANSPTPDLINPAIDPIIKKLQAIQVDKENEGEADKEKALIINSSNERLSFESTNRLKINKFQGSKNVYFDVFENYVLDSIKDQDYSRSTDIDENTLQTLIDNVLQIYHSDTKYKKILSNYLQFDVSSENNFIDWESPASSKKENPFIQNLNHEFLEDKKIPKAVMKNFNVITDIVNSSDFPDTTIGAVQILLMYVEYINRITKNNKALDFSKFSDELINNNQIFEPENMPNSAYKKPIEALVAIQNSLGEASEFIGFKWSEKGAALAFGQQESCVCAVPNAFNFPSPEQELTKELDPWEVVRPCPDNLNINEHIYTLTAYDEILSGEPNPYTLRPTANIRGSLMGAEYFLDLLKKKVSKESNGSIEFYFSLINDDYSKNKKAFQEGLNYFKNDKRYTETRAEILRIEQLIENYSNDRDEAYEEYAELTSKLKTLKDINDVDEKIEVLEDDEIESSNTFLDFEDIKEESEDYKRINYEITLIQNQIDTLLDLKKHWDIKIEELSLEKEQLLKKLYDLDIEKEDFEDAPWNAKIVKQIQIIIDTEYVSINPETVGVDVDNLSVDMKYLNTGRNPSSEDRPGEFFDNLPVGKIGGRLTDLMYEEGKTKVYPYLYPSIKNTNEENYEFSRKFEDLNWFTIHPKDEQFVTSFNMWISYLSMEVSKVSSKIEGPKPRLKVTGKDGEERDVFEVGSGIGQVLPVIAICLLAKPGEVVCIEEPEAHLHPSAQAYLADFLLAMSASGRQIIVETHSPNIIDRLRLRRVHKSWKKFRSNDWIKNELYLDDIQNIEKKYNSFREPDIKVIFAEQDDQGFSSYKEATIDKRGDIIFGQSQNEIWPDGFFDNAQEELTYILKARIASEEE